MLLLATHLSRSSVKLVGPQGSCRAWSASTSAVKTPRSVGRSVPRIFHSPGTFLEKKQKSARYQMMNHGWFFLEDTCTHTQIYIYNYIYYIIYILHYIILYYFIFYYIILLYFILRFYYIILYFTILYYIILYYLYIIITNCTDSRVMFFCHL